MSTPRNRSLLGSIFLDRRSVPFWILLLVVVAVFVVLGLTVHSHTASATEVCAGPDGTRVDDSDCVTAGPGDHWTYYPAGSSAPAIGASTRGGSPTPPAGGSSARSGVSPSGGSAGSGEESSGSSGSAGSSGGGEGEGGSSGGSSSGSSGGSSGGGGGGGGGE